MLEKNNHKALIKLSYDHRMIPLLHDPLQSLSLSSPIDIAVQFDTFTSLIRLPTCLIKKQDTISNCNMHYANYVYINFSYLNYVP